MSRRADHRGLAALVSLSLLASAAASQAQEPRSKQEERRRQLLEKMGLKETRPVPPAPPASSNEGAPGGPQAPDIEADHAGAESAETKKKAESAGGHRPSVSFRRVIHPLFLQACKTCHAAGGPAANTPLVLSGDAGADHAAILRVLDRRSPAASLLLLKASGQKPHGGGAPWPTEGAAYERVLAWIQGGARLDGGGPELAAIVPAKTPEREPRPAAPARAAGVAADRPTTEAVADGAVAVPATEAAAAAATVTATATAGVDFTTRVHPLLMSSCATCHGAKGMAAATRLTLSGEPGSDYAKVRALVEPASPAQSPLILKAEGRGHAGGAPLPTGSAGYTLLLAWVTEGAEQRPGVPGGVVGEAAAEAPSGASSPVVAATSATAPSTAPPVAPPAGHSLLALPYGLALNGRFDVAYERGNFSGDPFGSGATTALRSYHHFLFLSRESTDDPFGLSVEMLSLEFWEAHYRWHAPRLPVQIVLAGGKILVPFGADPLMHQSYGGLSGFDQRILPVIWAQEGVAAHVLFLRRELAVTDDLYLVRGYALHQANGILNLQNDFSPDDNARLGWGNRLGFAWGPLSAWYSSYYNGLGFGRRLFMQAGDVMLYRLRQIPVLGHFSFAAGLLRADVSGGNDQGNGGPGKDYYHFGSYFQARYHPTDWLYVQYRQGLRTFNNRRGLTIDDSRLTSDDGSTHNFGVVARTHGLTAGVYYFINLEKVDEIPNDLLRVSLTYDF